MTGRAARPGQTRGDGRLAVRCWCERRIVHVPETDVRRGLTGHCRRSDCKTTDRQHRQPTP